MIAGNKYDGCIADVWSCGVIMYTLICGFLPFEDADTNKLYQKIMDGEYEIPEEFVNPLAKDLMTKILETNPKKRLTL